MIRFSFLLIVLLTLPSWALPGEILPLAHPNFRAVGEVSATAVTENGEVFIAGDFDQVNGVSRPGLAKLTANGRLDDSFNPEVAPGNLPYQSFFPLPNRFYPDFSIWDGRSGFSLNLYGTARKPLELFALDQGRLFLRLQEAWTVLDATGKIDEAALPTFSREEGAPHPQFRRGNQLFVINADQKLVALDLENGDVIDETFNLDPAFDGPIQQAVPARNGVWTLSRKGSFNVVCRLLPDGTLDAGFPPLELRDGNLHELTPSSGGFGIITRNQGLFVTCLGVGGCGPPSNFVKVRRFSDIGSERSEVTLRFQGYLAPLMQVQNYLQLTYRIGNQWYSRSSNGEPFLLEGIGSASPGGDPVLPLSVRTINEINGGSLLQRKILVGGTRLYDRHGEIESSWQIPRLTRKASISKVLPQSDGGYFVSGDFGSGLARILPDGMIDPSFLPEVDLRFLQDFEVKKNGEVYALLNQSYKIDGALGGDRLFRLSPTGALRQTYFGDSLQMNLQIELLDDQSLIVVNGARNFYIDNSGVAVWHRGHTKILPNGELDADWKINDPQSLGFEQTYFGYGLRALQDGSFLSGRRQISSEGEVMRGIPGEGAVSIFGQDSAGWVYFREQSPQTVLRRWSPSEGLDPDFFFAFAPNIGSITKTTFGSRGKIYLHGSFQTAAGFRSLIRLHRTGQIDHSFCQPDLITRTAPAGASQILTYEGLKPNTGDIFSAPVGAATSIMQDGKLILFGFFDQPSKNVVALADTHVSGFEEWITATTGELRMTGGDFDRDGVSNLEEYALGSHPAFSDLAEQRIGQASHNVFEVPCNPEAPEIIREIEVSNDLKSWRVGTAAEVTLESRAACFRYRLAEQDRLFSRIRYSLR